MRYTAEKLEEKADVASLRCREIVERHTAALRRELLLKLKAFPEYTYDITVDHAADGDTIEIVAVATLRPFSGERP